VWRGTLPRKFDLEIRNVWNGDKNYWEFISHIKHLVVQWILFWPISILHTILRHPLKILIDIVFELSQRKYVWLTNFAMSLRMKKKDE
jgi:hypothetical protein